MQPEIFRSVLLVVSLLLVPSFAWADWEPTEVVGLVYPRAARSARITGVVVVRLSLDSQGVVTAATILSGHPVLAKAAKENAGRWKFKDSQQSPTSGDPILVYHFSLSGSCASDDCAEGFEVEYPNFILVYSAIPAVQPTIGERKGP